MSGNVSLYNETNGSAILPTPAIGGVGVIDDLDKMTTVAFKAPGDVILLVGQKDTASGWLGQSLYLREVAGREEGAPPPVDLKHEKLIGDFVRNLIQAGRVTACHDLSDGGLAVGLTEMALAGNIGCLLNDPGVPRHGRLFGEDQGRYVLTVKAADATAILREAEPVNIPVQMLGVTGGKDIVLADETAVSLADLRQLHEGWFPTYMSGKN
ncbi:MAG: hypothetical protein EBY18_24705 [Alphaproteobacteria bacterium]|nr:hypothetical protein [Alphaproteobacteria bacterium]